MVRENIPVSGRTTEIENCTFAKTILMLFVVLGHCLMYWAGGWFVGTPAYPAKGLGLLADWINSFHIYGFALVSGYLFYYLKYEKGKYSAYGPFLRKKAKRLLVPYAFAALVWVIPFVCVFYPVGVDTILMNFVLGAAPQQLWFLLMLFGVFLIIYPLSDFLKKQNVWGAVVVLGFYGVGVIGSRLLNLFQIFTACLYMPVFWCGFRLRQMSAEGKSNFFRRIPAVCWLLAQLAFFVLSQYLRQFSGLVFTLLQVALDFSTHILGALMAFFVLQKIAEKCNWKQSRLFTFLSRQSMPVYLLHQQVVFISIYFLNGLLNPYIHAAVNLVAALAVSLALSAVLQKCRVTRFLIGEG